MDHRSQGEAEGVAAQAERVAFLDGLRAAFQGDAFEELREHLQGGGRGHKRHGRIFFQHPGHQRGVVGLHVVDDEVVGLALAERLGQVGLPGFALAAVGRVEDGDFLVEDDIGIIGHPFGHYVLAFEEVDVEVVDPDEFDGRSDIFDHDCKNFRLILQK